VPTYSYSGLQSFDQCPRKFAFKYRERVDVGRTTTVEAFLGSRAHEALEWLYRGVSVGRTPLPGEVARRYCELWDAEWCDDVVITKEVTPAEYRDLGERMVRGYAERFSPFVDGQTIGTEVRIDARLDAEGAYRLMGYADRVVRVAPGQWQIHDYKTGSRLPPQRELDEDRQLALYELGLREMYAEVDSVELVWHYLAFDIDLRSTRTPQQREDLRVETIARIQSAESCTEFPTRTSALCGWCEYRGVCPAFIHERAVAEGGDEAADGVALVDLYAELDDRIGVLQREKDAAARRITDFAAEHGYDVVVGTDHQVKVWRKENACSLPSWDDPRRKRIEEVLRTAGLWERFSSLATVGLSRALEEGTLPPDVAEEIMEFATMESRSRLYVRARGGRNT
jgi:putative RecB family exonuclease